MCWWQWKEMNGKDVGTDIMLQDAGTAANVLSKLDPFPFNYVIM